MDCQKIKEYLSPFIDGELEAEISLSVKEHISACPLCNLELEEEKKIDSFIRYNFPKENAPYELKERILSSIEESEERKRGRVVRHILEPALAGIVLSFLSIILFSLLSRPFPVFSETIKEHIQSLQGGPPIGLVSNNPKEISRSLQSQLNFKVMVPDLSSQGANLLGARACALKNKEVAYMLYEKDRHSLSVFMFEAKKMRFPKAKKVRLNNKTFYLGKDKGYNSTLWVDEGIACVFVSDLDEAELIYLASL